MSAIVDVQPPLRRARSDFQRHKRRWPDPNPALEPFASPSTLRTHAETTEENKFAPLDVRKSALESFELSQEIELVFQTLRAEAEARRGFNEKGKEPEKQDNSSTAESELMFLHGDPDVAPRRAWPALSITSQSTQSTGLLPRGPWHSFPSPPPSPTPASSTGHERSFDPYELPTTSQIAAACELEVFDNCGGSAPFRRIISASPTTIVIFIRHFWCPLCQDYMRSIEKAAADLLALGSVGISLVFISNGDPRMINGYKRIFRIPVTLYTDPSRKLYEALGMKAQNVDLPSPPPSPPTQCFPLSPIAPSLSSIDKTSETVPHPYVRHGLLSGIGMVVYNALRAGIPLFAPGGDITQLGGEFVFQRMDPMVSPVSPSSSRPSTSHTYASTLRRNTADSGTLTSHFGGHTLMPPVKCIFAHRMHKPDTHDPFKSVLSKAGYSSSPVLPPTPIKNKSALPRRSSQEMLQKPPRAKLRKRRVEPIQMHVSSATATRGPWRPTPGQWLSTRSSV